MLFSKDLFPWHNFATKKPKLILKVWVEASQWTLHHITSHYHHIIGYHGITLSSWSHQGFGLQVASSLRRCPTDSNGEVWDGTRQPLDAAWYGPTMPNGISQLPNVQKKVCAEAPAIYGSVMQCPHGYSDQQWPSTLGLLEVCVEHGYLDIAWLHTLALVESILWAGTCQHCVLWCSMVIRAEIVGKSISREKGDA